MLDAVVIGGGPAGLMAADALLCEGRSVLLAEAKPSLGRKFLMAGKSGLNLTRMEHMGPFLSAYGSATTHLTPILHQFGPTAVNAWAEGLGQQTFTGSTGRVFPRTMKASPLLRAWLERLRGMGMQQRTRWYWTGWNGEALRFDSPDGPQDVPSRTSVFALGGASWSRLGSDGRWARVFREAGIPVATFSPANAGVHVNWSDHMAQHLGAPLKNLKLQAGPLSSRGEIVLSKRGIEGGGIYPLTPALREGAALFIDLCPDLDVAEVARRLARPKAKMSAVNRLRKALPLSPAAIALVMEMARPLPSAPRDLAQRLKTLPVMHQGPRPLDEAISTAGGVSWSALDDGLMVTSRPGMFCAGEMLDWEAPTGGYLLTASLATGLWAGQHAARYCQE